MADDQVTLDYIVSKFNLDINQPSPISIPNFVRENLYQLVAELGFMRGVEIGVQNGKNAKCICDNNPHMEMYGVDPWEQYDDLAVWSTQEGFDAGYEEAKATVPSNCTLIRKKSMDAVGDFADGYFDFVYVDGNHEFWSATMDIHFWLQKVRVGGILAGHDYRRYYPNSFIHVYQVVNAYTQAYAIKPWFITDGEKVRSFFWVKTDPGYRREV